MTKHDLIALFNGLPDDYKIEGWNPFGTIHIKIKRPKSGELRLEFSSHSSQSVTFQQYPFPKQEKD